MYGDGFLTLRKAYCSRRASMVMSAFSTLDTGVVHGTGDATVPIDPTGRAAAKAIGDSELKEYDGAPHGLTATHASQLNADLLAFCQKLSTVDRRTEVSHSHLTDGAFE